MLFEIGILGGLFLLAAATEYQLPLETRGELAVLRVSRPHWDWDWDWHFALLFYMRRLIWNLWGVSWCLLPQVPTMLVALNNDVIMTVAEPMNLYQSTH